jgi:hypothetical protein
MHIEQENYLNCKVCALYPTCTGFWYESPKEKNHLKDQGVDGRIGSKWTLGRLAGEVWSGFTWLRIGIVGGLL